MNSKSTQLPLIKHFEKLDDYRQQHKIDHLLIDIVGITILAVIANANSWTEIEEFGNAKKDRLKKYFLLPNGIPSHDTFRYFFMHLNPKTNVLLNGLVIWIYLLKIKLFLLMEKHYDILLIPNQKKNLYIS